MARNATATSCANIAFIKYWGNVDDDLRLPYNDSLSMNLSEARTTTAVAFEAGAQLDTVVIDGIAQGGASYQRVVAHLDRIRSIAGLADRATVTSTNTFPMGTGIASSASGFAALTVAAAAAAGLDLPEARLSALARRASGSAARSVPGGFVEWRAAMADEASFAFSFAPPDHWDLRDLVAVVSHTHKQVGSTGGHSAAVLSPYFGARLGELRSRLPLVQQALIERDFETLGPAVEAEAISLHVVAMTGRPPLLYWSPETVRLLHQVADWRKQGLPVYFTLDAGPNVHLLCEGQHAEALAAALAAESYVERVLHNRPGGPTILEVPSTQESQP